MAVWNRPITGDLIFHSDWGIQYACKEFTDILRANKLVTQSMSRKGNCWDNAVAESFFKTIKVEWIYGHKYLNQVQAQLSIHSKIESWYNRRGRHSALNYQTIEEYEKNNCNFKNVA
jgi:putative transposase